MSLTVIIPWGTDHGQRERLWKKLHAEWLATPFSIIVARDPLHREPREDGTPHPFSVGRAVNNAMRTAHPEFDRFIIWGADQLPDVDAITWADNQLSGGRKYVLPFNTAVSLTQEGTEDYLAGREVTWSAPCAPSPLPGILAFTRATWDRVGGFDERYEGWGYEDVDLLARLNRDVQPVHHLYSGLPLKCLWHSDGDPAQHRNDFTDANPNVKLFRGTSY